MDICRRINEIYPNMTKKQKQIADYMLQNTETLTFITLKELSKATGVTEITILNTCRLLGYDSFNEVKYEFRKIFNQNQKNEFFGQNEYHAIEVPEYELNDKEKLLYDIAQEEKRLMDETINNLDIKKIFQLAERIHDASWIVVCGRGVSYMLAEHLVSGFAALEIPTVKVNTELNESVYAAIPSIDKRALVIAVSFPDYFFVTTKMAEFAKNNHVPVIGITDSAEAPIVEFSDETLLVSSMTRMSLNTLSSPMAMINLLISSVKIVCKNRKHNKKDEKFAQLFREQ